MNVRNNNGTNPPLSKLAGALARLSFKQRAAAALLLDPLLPKILWWRWNRGVPTPQSQTVVLGSAALGAPKSLIRSWKTFRQSTSVHSIDGVERSVIRDVITVSYGDDGQTRRRTSDGAETSFRFVVRLSTRAVWSIGQQMAALSAAERQRANIRGRTRSDIDCCCVSHRERGDLPVITHQSALTRQMADRPTDETKPTGSSARHATHVNCCLHHRRQSLRHHEGRDHKKYMGAHAWGNPQSLFCFIGSR